MTQAYDRVCRKIYTNLLIFEPFRSQTIGQSAYLTLVCLVLALIINRLNLERSSRFCTIFR